MIVCVCQALVTPTVASIYKNSATLSNTVDEEKKKFIHQLMDQEAKRRDEFVIKLKEFQEKDGLKPGQNEFGTHARSHSQQQPARSKRTNERAVQRVPSPRLRLLSLFLALTLSL